MTFLMLLYSFIATKKKRSPPNCSKQDDTRDHTLVKHSHRGFTDVKWPELPQEVELTLTLFHREPQCSNQSPLWCRCRLPGTCSSPLCPQSTPAWKRGSQETSESFSGPPPGPLFWWHRVAGGSGRTMIQSLHSRSRPSHQRTSANDRTRTGTWSLWDKEWRGREGERSLEVT